MILLDSLRPPSLLDPTAARYKDWFHLNVLDHESGSIGIINVSLHGAPDDPRSRAVGTALVHVPDIGWVGNLEIRGINEVGIGSASIAMERVAVAINHASGTFLASIRDHENAITVNVTATASAIPLLIEQRVPLGNGWISWYAVPRVKVVGNWTLGGVHADLQKASAYHDHNWGRWQWGDDLGWEWGCFLTPAPGVSIILSRVSDSAHRHFGTPSLVVQTEGRRKSFAGAAIDVNYTGVLQEITRRLPGAMAALHQDHAQPRLPKDLRIRADDGNDRVEVKFTARAATQLIVADPHVTGYGFIHEIAGEFVCSVMIDDLEIEGSGLGVLEHVY